MKLSEIFLKSIFFFFICTNALFAQKSGIDSVRSVSWTETPFFFPSGDKSVVHIETPFKTSDHVVFLYCKDSSFLMDYSREFPPHCVALLSDNTNKMDNSSLSKMFIDCVHDYYYNPTTHAKIDTIYVSDEYSTPEGKNPVVSEWDEYSMTSMEMRSVDRSSVFHNEYYTLNELKNSCWHGTPFRLKSTENWENGRKNGRWTYNDTNGETMREIEYEDGVPVSDKSFTKDGEEITFNLPEPIAFFNDFEKVLSEKEAKILDEMLVQFEKETTNEFAVVSIDTYSPYQTMFDYSLDLANFWGLGKPESDNGVLLVFSKNKREYRIQVGKGLESKLTNAECEEIFNNHVLPEFKAGNYYKGLETAIRLVMEQIK